MNFNGKKHVIKFEKFGLARILKEKGIAVIEFFDEKSCAYIVDFEGNNLIEIKNENFNRDFFDLHYINDKLNFFFKKNGIDYRLEVEDGDN
ncbi:hypothetical protein FS764_08530 [Agrobacterium vitis]|uniref:hypothetical protein n=1 Tax=Agrobacterium vitis TaxID=373 RepID=UPI001F438BA0|nr:hypothetical protein [Agrobacterium vitis]MCF1466955.1 hypothetical protein [Agrobacterium vitis]